MKYGRPYKFAPYIGQNTDSPLAELKDDVHKRMMLYMINQNQQQEFMVQIIEVNWDKKKEVIIGKQKSRRDKKLNKIKDIICMMKLKDLGLELDFTTPATDKDIEEFENKLSITRRAIIKLFKRVWYIEVEYLGILWIF